MNREKVFIVLSHKHNLKKGSKTLWESIEKVEFVNQLREKHYSMSSAIGDYINRKMITGERAGMGDYDKFELYISKKYEKQLSELDMAYKELQVRKIDTVEMITDTFGNVRPATVFDV